MAARLPDLQVVFSTGRNVDADALGPIPSNTLVVPSAPQLELLERAALCITHAGLNTTQEALAAGVPLVAIPVGYDQPGVAARILYHGVGRFVPFEELTVDSVLREVREVLGNPGYREKAAFFEQLIRDESGAERAAKLVEQVLSGAI